MAAIFWWFQWNLTAKKLPNKIKYRNLCFDLISKLNAFSAISIWAHMMMSHFIAETNSLRSYFPLGRINYAYFCWFMLYYTNNYKRCDTFLNFFLNAPRLNFFQYLAIRTQIFPLISLLFCYLLYGQICQNDKITIFIRFLYLLRCTFYQLCMCGASAVTWTRAQRIMWKFNEIAQCDTRIIIFLQPQNFTVDTTTRGKKRSLGWKKCLKSNKNKKPKNTRLLTCVDFIYYYDYYFFVVCLMYFMLAFFIVWYRHSADTLHILRYSYFAFEPLDSRCRLTIPLCSWTKQFAHRNYIIM